MSENTPKKNKIDKHSPDAVLQRLTEKMPELQDEVEKIEPDVTGKAYITSVYSKLKEKRVVSAMHALSTLMGKKSNWFHAISNKPSGTQRRIALSYASASKLHLATKGLFDVDRMIPWLKDQLAEMGYYRLGKEVTPECEEVLNGLGYKRKKPKA